MTQPAASDAAAPTPKPGGGARPFLMAFGVIAALFIAPCARVMMVDTQPRDPTSSAEGIVCQVLEQGGRKPVRCAMMLDAEQGEVLSLVRDYAHFSEVFEGRGWHFDVTKADVQPDGRVHFVGQVRTRVQSWPIDVHISRVDEAGASYDRWDDKGGSLAVNRGEWKVARAGEGKTVLSYMLDLEVKEAPALFVRELMFVELRSPLRRIKRRLDERKGAK